jgi:hypothetical protein
MNQPSSQPPSKITPATPTEKKFPTNPRRKVFSTEDHESKYLHFHRPELNNDEHSSDVNPEETPMRKTHDSRNMTPLHKAQEPRDFGRNTDCGKSTPYNENPEVYEQ